MTDINVIRNGKVAVEPTLNRNQDPCLRIIVNDRYSHTFSANSRESRMLAEIDMDTIRQMLNGGTFVFSQEKLVDYRADSHDTYQGFVQSDEAIKQLIEHIGFKNTKKETTPRGARGLYDGVRSRATNGAIFGGNGDPFDLVVPELGVGGEFDGHIVFGWSVFSDKVVTSLNVRRLVCENGQVADAPFVAYEVPVVNQWEDNLAVVNARLKPVITDVLGRRFAEMNERAATLDNVTKAHKIIKDRKTALENEAGTAEACARLARLSGFLNPESHLGHIVKESAMSNPKIAAQIDGHLSQFDLYNILTEATTHYGRHEATDKTATALANRIVFDELVKRPKPNFTLKPSEEFDHRTAFIGES